MQGSLGALAARRKPLQDSPTPAGNPAAAITLLRLHAYSGDNKHREIAESTLGAFAGIAGHFGIFGATYGIAVAVCSRPHIQAVIIGKDEKAHELYRAALSPFSISNSVLQFNRDHVVEKNLPPTLAQTIPNLPALKQNKSFALLCSGFSCQPPIESTSALKEHLRQQEPVSSARKIS